MRSHLLARSHESNHGEGLVVSRVSSRAAADDCREHFFLVRTLKRKRSLPSSVDTRVAQFNRPASHAGTDEPAARAPVRSSFREIYDRTSSFVVRAARKLGVDERDLDDVTQEVFLTVYRRLSDFEGRSSVKTWVSSILSKLVQNYRRGKRRKGGMIAPE